MVLSMERWIGKVAIVTGASSGIGAAISEQLVKAGLKVVGLARRNEIIEEQAKKLSGKKGKLYAIKCDMTKEEDIINAFKYTKKNIGPVSILINNAGLLQQADLLSGNTDQWRKVFDTNVLAICIATREAYQQMKSAHINGHIIHINSIAGHWHLPGLNVYSASKHSVTALTESLRHELNAAKSKIKITSVSPGIVETEIFRINNFEFPQEVSSKLEKVALKPEDIADGIIYALSTPTHVQIHELIIKPVNETL